MIISIKSKEFNLTLPVPLFLGGLVIRFVPKKYLNAHEKKLAILLFKKIKYSLKCYKGLKLVEIISQNGEHITIKV